MNLRWVWLNHVRGMAQRWSRVLLAVMAVGAGAATAVGVVIASHSVTTSVAKFNTSVSLGAAYRIEATADHGALDGSVLPAVQHTPGVKTAVPVVMTVVQAVDSRGYESLVPALGFDCSIEAVVGSFGCDPTTIANPTATPTPIIGPALQKQLGSQGVLRTDLADLSTAASFAPRQLQRINHGRVAVFPLAAAQQQFVRPNGLDAILVIAQPGADLAALRVALVAAVGPQNHVFDASTAIGGGFESVVQLVSAFLFIISIIGLVIGAQLVRNTLELSLEERRREMATSAALGATPRDVVSGILVESAITGVLATVVALAGGALIATAFVSKLSVELGKSTGLGATVSIPRSAAILGLVVALGVSIGASIRPARRASKLDLVSELSGRTRYDAERTDTRRGPIMSGVLALAMLALGFVAHRGGSLDGWQPPASLLALVGSMVVGYTLSVQLSPRLLALLQRAPWFSTGPGRIALTNIVRARRRTVAIAIAITAPVFFSAILGGITPGMAQAARGIAYGINRGNVYVSTLPSNNAAGIDSKVTPTMEAAMRAVPGVASVDHQYFSAFNDPQLGIFSVEAFEGTIPLIAVYRGAPAQDVFARGQVMVGPSLARRAHLAPGETMTLAARTGPRQSFVVGGIWASPDNLGNSVTMRADQLVTLTGPRPAANVSLRPVAGVSAAELAARVHAANISPRLRIMTTEQLATDFAKQFREIASAFDALRGALIVVALVATASTLVLAAAQRRRDNATLAALGMAPADLARSTLIETVITSLGVTVVATACAQIALVNFMWSSGLTTGLAMPYRFSISPVLTAALATTLIALVGAALPAWRTARTDVMKALRTA